jgi:hypothetical protein
VAVALLDGGADMDFATPPSGGFTYSGFTPLMYAAKSNHSGRGLHSFPFQLNLSTSAHRVTQLNS